jgi:hypothetical protein
MTLLTDQYLINKKFFNLVIEEINIRITALISEGTGSDPGHLASGIRIRYLFKKMAYGNNTQSINKVLYRCRNTCDKAGTGPPRRLGDNRGMVQR